MYGAALVWLRGAVYLFGGATMPAEPLTDMWAYTVGTSH
jgi:hypothetical protein